MIPNQRDDKMIVQMTKGELYELVGEIVSSKLQGLTDAIADRVAEVSVGSDIVMGGEEIARTIGVNRNTMYKMMNEGKLPCVKHYGKKLTARRSELYKAISNIS
ncbi:MAG: helix-turn-helix domain-containing protein [Bacteroidales bacterium]|nr:helix-turn-helix domain-containing protein [Bacteroidales bacterium]